MTIKNSSKLKSIRNIAEWFLLCSIMGWLYEVVWWGYIENNAGFTNRGFLFGPWLPIYGFGMLLVNFVLEKFKITTPFKVFLVGMSLTTIAELAGSYIMEAVTGSFLWSYEGFFMNFEGRIALKPALLFGFLVCGAIFGIKPRLEKLQKQYSDSVIHNSIFVFISLLFLADLFSKLLSL